MNFDILLLQQQLQREKTLSLTVKVIPKSSHNSVVGFMENGTLKIKINAVPEHGRANSELCAYLAKVLNLPKQNITISRGGTSHTKLLKITHS